MNEKYKNKYRVNSIRAQWWNYSNSGAYFITICTANRKPFFGNIVEHKMHLTPIGKIAARLWNETVNHAKNINLGEFVVMPNHIHGLVIIDKMRDKNATDMVSGNNEAHVETRHALSLPDQNQPPRQSRFRNIGKNTISSIIAGYKSAVTRQCNKMGFDFAWQSRFYDHIIRNDEEYDQIVEYIVNNPLNWRADTLWVT
jgi:REP element-mobilizing transposase RayT